MSLWCQVADTLVAAYMRVRWGWDAFGHDETDTWGDLETSIATQTWSNVGGAVSSYSIANGYGVHTLITNTGRLSFVDADRRDMGVTGRFLVDVIPTGAAIRAMTALCVVDEDDLYICDVVIDTDLTVIHRIQRAVAGNFVVLDTFSTPITHTVTTVYGISSEIVGDTIRSRVWDATNGSGTSEPTTWQVEKSGENDPTYPQTGGAGVRSAKSAGNTNSPNPTVKWLNVDLYEPATYVDITGSVLAPDSGAIRGTVGRATELEDINPSSLSFTLENQNGWFTPDNAVSPYHPDWRTGTPIRWTEAVGARSFPFPDMWLEIPEVELTFEAQGDPELTDRVMRVNAVDLLTRLQRAPRFVSNLAEYIKHEAPADTLRAYWPLADASGSTYATSYGPIAQEPLRFERVGSFQPTKFIDTLLNFGGAAGPYGDDATALEFTPISTDSSDYRGRIGTSGVISCNPGASGIVTLVAWIYPTDVFGQIVLIRDSAFTVDIELGCTGTSWEGSFATTAGLASVTGPEVITNQWHLLAVRGDFSDGTFDFWVDGWTGAGAAAGGGGAAITRCVIDGGQTGYRVAHVQVYVGDYTHEDFLAQWHIGADGWPHQSVDERIRLIANYAGITDSRLELEPSDSLIQPPSFAGQAPGDLAPIAAATGGGIMFTRASELVYHDRKHRFDL